ncbi:nephrin-like isoform X2 [Portunus trituberculatus]|uniref:nephrin-like isoform X2 n=1 Tax=Portunus trituberculatus TaxID=210409 RepID=UPI001E1D198D|nr:nephrin-like isoform X2 [Portunus trituberculatus]
MVPWRGRDPVYSYDQRLGVSGESWADPQVFQGRAHYLAHLSPPAMLIMRATVDDAHVYRCRVDFHNSNSRVAWVKLEVIVPPERVEIIPERSPVKPGDKNDVVCRAVGGKPPASVVWVQGGRVVDPNSTVEGDGTFNSLEVPASRRDLTIPFICQASNNDVTEPVTAFYTRNVTCGPVNVKVTASENPLVEGREAEITCRATGSNPPAVITWYREGRTMDAQDINVTRQDTETVSVLSLVPARQHHGLQLLCRAENPSLPLAALEQIFVLNVAYRPKAELRVEWPQDFDLLTEGGDLFLECMVESNPEPYKIKFFHDGHELVHNVSKRILVTKASLALQEVSRHTSGRYQCLASNVEGDALSNNLTIAVKYSPRCVLTPGVVGAALGQVTNVTCRVEADPANVTFMWSFSNAARHSRSRPIDRDMYTTSGLTSVLQYRPSTVRDYGTLSCYANNSVGTQKEPCTFTLVTAGPPERVTNCSVFNVTSHTAEVSCSPGFNGGLPQSFLHQVRVADTGQVLYNVTSDEPGFMVKLLGPGRQYEAVVMAYNGHGNSRPAVLPLLTLTEADMHKISSVPGLPSRPKPRRLVWVLGVVVGVVVGVAGAAAGVWWVRGRGSSHTLRNREDCMTKLHKPDLTGNGRDAGDAMGVNGVVQHTIYDSMGRYRGFAHLQQNDMYQNSMMTTSVAATSAATPTPSAPPADPPSSLTSKFSLIRKGKPSTTPAPPIDPKCGSEAMNGRGGGASIGGGLGDRGGGSAGGSGEGGSEGGRGAGGEEEKSEAPWQRVISHLTSSSNESKFFDVWRIPGVRSAKQQAPNESVL